MLILDEPTAHLDALSEGQVVAVLRELKASGSTILVIAHRNAVVQAADTVLHVASAGATDEEIQEYPQLEDDFELADLSGTLPGLLDPAALNPVGDGDVDVELEVRK